MVSKNQFNNASLTLQCMCDLVLCVLTKVNVLLVLISLQEEAMVPSGLTDIHVQTGVKINNNNNIKMVY